MKFKESVNKIETIFFVLSFVSLILTVFISICIEDESSRSTVISIGSCFFIVFFFIGLKCSSLSERLNTYKCPVCGSTIIIEKNRILHSQKNDKTYGGHLDEKNMCPHCSNLNLERVNFE